MIGVDTNIVVRLLTRDEPIQFDAAVGLIKKARDSAPLFVNPLVIVETIWVLERVYRIAPRRARDQVRGLLDTVELTVPRAVSVESAMDWLRSPHRNFSDVAIAGINRENGCDFTYTFDKQAVRRIDSMELLT